MKLKREKVQTFWVNAICDCGGTFERDHERNPIDDNSNPPQYWHVCDKCGRHELLNTSYPRLEQEVVHE